MCALRIHSPRCEPISPNRHSHCSAAWAGAHWSTAAHSPSLRAHMLDSWDGGLGIPLVEHPWVDDVAALSTKGSMCLGLLSSLACFVALGIELCPWLQQASTDALLLPVPRGHKRNRRVPDALKTEVARVAGEGGLARSCNAALQVVRRFNRFARFQKPQSSNQWVVREVAGYFEAVRRQWSGDAGPIVSISMDATRLGGRETLVAAMWSSTLRLAAWCPAGGDLANQGLSCRCVFRVLVRFGFARIRVNPRKAAQRRATARNAADSRVNPRIGPRKRPENKTGPFTGPVSAPPQVLRDLRLDSGQPQAGAAEAEREAWLVQVLDFFDPLAVGPQQPRRPQTPPAPAKQPPPQAQPLPGRQLSTSARPLTTYSWVAQARAWKPTRQSWGHPTPPTQGGVLCSAWMREAQA